MARRPDIDGRRLLINAALKLFAEHGIDAVSIRAVNREAGVGPATAHYHFGTKDALVEAALEVYGAEVRSAMTERAHELETSGSAITARDLVQMLVAPYLDLASSRDTRSADWVRFLGKALQSEPGKYLAHSPITVIARTAARVYPECPPARRERALRMCLSVLLTHLAEPTPRGTRRARADLDLLVAFLSGGLEAALDGPTPFGSTESA